LTAAKRARPMPVFPEEASELAKEDLHQPPKSKEGCQL
jgi:hypothetical protein